MRLRSNDDSSPTRRFALVLLALCCALLVAACGGDDDSSGDDDSDTKTTTTTTTTESDDSDDEPQNAVDMGKTVFGNNCGVCHGANAGGGNGGPAINSGQELAAVVAQVTNGGGGMPAFKGQLSDEEINAVSEYVVSVQQ